MHGCSSTFILGQPRAMHPSSESASFNSPHNHRTKPCSPCRLPQELLDTIVDKLAGDIDTLKSCTLASPLLHSRSTANLFAARPAHIPRWAIERLSTVRASPRIREHIVSLGLELLCFEQWRIVKDLPRLRELTITHCEPTDGGAAASPPPPEPTGRAIGYLKLYRIPLYCADWVLRLFASIGRLCFHYVHADPVVPLAPARHIVRHLQTNYLDAAALRYLSSAVDPAALETLETNVSGPFYTGDGHETVVHEFVQVLGRHIWNYRFATLMSSYFHPDPPNLTALGSITHVTLRTDSFDRARYPRQWELDLAFLASLPPRVCHLTLLWDNCGHLDGDNELVEGIQAVDWDAVSRALDYYADLTRLRIGAVTDGPWVPFRPLKDNEAAQVAILAGFSARLRYIIRFV